MIGTAKAPSARPSSSSAKFTKLRKRFAIPALVSAVIALVLALPALASADPLGSITSFSAGLNGGTFPYSVAPGPDGNLWFTDQGATPAIGRITPAGTITEFSAGLKAGSKPTAIAPGPDGNVWFTDEGTTPAIGRITPAGTITEFSAGGASEPVSITSGPDGNLWFADKSTPAIGRITPTGTITKFSAGLNVGAKPESIALGPDGNLWFTDLGVTRAIGRITPAGTITEFSAGLNPGSIPGFEGFSTGAAIAPGPDGNVWFIDDGSTKAIGRITPAGTITEFSAGLQASPALTAIALGPDGNVWFADLGAFEGGSNEFGRITPTGTITEFSAEAAFPLGLAPGPEGEDNLWFTDFVTPAIGKFGTETAALTVNHEGNGEGTVQSDPAGITCVTGTCSASFAKEAKVTLTASAAPGSTFTSWKKCDKTEGGFGVEGRKCTVKMSAAKTVGAKFTKVLPVTATKDPTGTGVGTISSSPAGISCAPACTTATAAFTEGATSFVYLKAAPLASSSEFNGETGWTNCPGEVIVAENKCKVTMTGVKSAEAKFTSIPQNTLTLEKAGVGTGTVSSSPAGISCGATCTEAEASFLKTKSVTLKAIASKGSTFTGWTVNGGACPTPAEPEPGTFTCALGAMTAAKEVTATFE